MATTTYDALGRVTRESNRGLATQYEYDQNGNRTLMVDPSGGRFMCRYGEGGVCAQKTRHTVLSARKMK